MQAPKALKRTFAEITVGDEAHFVSTINTQTVDDFARLSGDYNPLHTDEVYATATPFGSRVAHGMLAGALFSRLLGMQLPGLYCVYLSQTLKFKNPIYLDIEIEVRGEVLAKSEASQTLTVAMTLTSTKDGLLLVAGDALVRVME